MPWLVNAHGKHQSEEIIELCFQRDEHKGCFGMTTEDCFRKTWGVGSWVFEQRKGKDFKSGEIFPFLFKFPQFLK